MPGAPAPPAPPQAAPLDRNDAATWPELLTAGETAYVLGLHPESVRQWLRDGRLPGVRIGRAWFVRKPDLLDRRTTPGEDDTSPE